jgi:hypothetical protein
MCNVMRFAVYLYLQKINIKASEMYNVPNNSLESQKARICCECLTTAELLFMLMHVNSLLSVEKSPINILVVI